MPYPRVRDRPLRTRLRHAARLRQNIAHECAAGPTQGALDQPRCIAIPLTLVVVGEHDGRVARSGTIEHVDEGRLAKQASSLSDTQSVCLEERVAYVQSHALALTRCRSRLRGGTQLGGAISFKRAPHNWKASLEAPALFIRNRVSEIYAEVGQLDTLRRDTDHSRGRADPREEVLMFLVWSPSERVDGL